MRSGEEDVQIAAGRAVSVRGEHVSMTGEREVEISGGQLQLAATGYNANVQVHTVGGALTVGKLGISGATVASHDALSGLRMRSAEDVEIAAGAGRDHSGRRAGGDRSGKRARGIQLGFQEESQQAEARPSRPDEGPEPLISH